MELDDLISVNDVSKVTGLSRKTIYRYMSEGLLKYVQTNHGRRVKYMDLLVLKPKRKAQSVQLDELEQLANEVKLLREEVTQLRHMLGVSMTHFDNVKDTVMTQHCVNDTPYSIGKSSNEGRQLEAIAKVKAMLDKYPNEEERPSISAMAKEANMDRSTFGKHLRRLE